MATVFILFIILRTKKNKIKNNKKKQLSLILQHSTVYKMQTTDSVSLSRSSFFSLYDFFLKKCNGKYVFYIIHPLHSPVNIILVYTYQYITRIVLHEF
jgi:hypothetical protein